MCLLAVVGLIGFAGCGRVTPPGKKVIVVKANGENEVIETGAYKAWGRDREFLLDQKYFSNTERMQILCADDINLDVEVKAILGFDTEQNEGETKQDKQAKIDFIKDRVPSVKVDGYDGELSFDKFYTMVLSDIIRGTSRNVISSNETEEVRPKRQELEAKIQESIIQRIDSLGYPVRVSAVLISNIDYPQSVTETRERIKQAELKDLESAALAEAELAEQQRQVAVEQEKAKVRMVKAQAQADENEILTKSLTPEFLMWRQMEVMELTAGKLAEGQSNTVFMMPYQTMSPEMLNTSVIKNSVDSLKTTVNNR